jgi:hypothetical protein
MAANMSWYTQNKREGIREEPIDGLSRTPFKPKYSAQQHSDQFAPHTRSDARDSLKSPMNLLPVSLNAKLNPQKNHWKETTARVTIERKIIDRAFLRRRRPE